MPHAGPGTPPSAESWSYARIGQEDTLDDNFAAVDGSARRCGLRHQQVESAFGRFLVADGFFLDDRLTDFSFLPEAAGKPDRQPAATGKRPMSAMSPTLVYVPTARLLLALGSAGGPRIIMHVLDAGRRDRLAKPVGDAITLPNLFLRDDGVLLNRAPRSRRWRRR